MVLRVLLFMVLFLSGLKVAELLSMTWFEILLPAIITLVMIFIVFTISIFTKSEGKTNKRRN